MSEIDGDGRRSAVKMAAGMSLTAPTYSWPSPDPGDDFGLVALDRDLSAARLISAYRHGIFPWPDAMLASAIPWVSPARRAILEFSALHIPRNLRRSQRSHAGLRYTADYAFDAVIKACAAAYRPGQRGTWITASMIEAYTELHRLGHAHSIEAWEGDTLVAGLYGVTAGGVFTGESMFHLVDDGSKLCVLRLIEHLRARGATWIDIQQLTRHFALMGAREIPREKFLGMLASEQRAARRLFP